MRPEKMGRTLSSHMLGKRRGRKGTGEPLKGKMEGTLGKPRMERQKPEASREENPSKTNR
jgi:hypothetical protein